MDYNRVVNYIESSFLHDLLMDEDVTDISYNGANIYYLHNEYGRKESDIQISSNDVRDFIRQIANITEKQFSYQNPILDVTAGKYRINAVHPSIARNNEEPVIAFALRVASIVPRITNESAFLTPYLIVLFQTLLKCGLSMVIGGMTGCGKTEFQKYLIREMPSMTRIIIIDNVLELSLNPVIKRMDINIWQADERNNNANIQLLVKNALRSNPDWLIVAESRGDEMVEILNSAMTGHPIITTIHAYNAQSMSYRLARMVMMNDKRSSYEEILRDINHHFPFYIYLKRKITKQGQVKRFIESIVFNDINQQSYLIYEFKNGKHLYYRFPESALNLVGEVDDEVFNKIFGRSKNETA